MKKIFLLFIILFFCTHSNAQQLDLYLLIKEYKENQEQFLKTISENNFKLYKTNTDKKFKIDSVSYINKENIEIGLVKIKKNDSFYIKNVNENAIQNIEQQFEGKSFLLIDTKIANNNSIEKTYINLELESEIVLKIIGISNKNDFRNFYDIKIAYPKNFKSKYRKQIKEKSVKL